MTLALPFFIIIWLFKQAITGDRDWQTRIGLYPNRFDCHLWIHAVSLGEVNTVIPLIDELKRSHPQLPILLTSNTRTGIAQARRIMSQYGSVIALHPPYDLPFFVRRFIKAFAPKQAIIMEADLWPGVLSYCGQKKIPRLLINARLPPASMKRRKQFARIFVPLNSMLDRVCAQTSEDARNFIALGMKDEEVKVCGNLKFDIQLPKQSQAYGIKLRSLIGNERRVWIAASTHRGEEAAALTAHHQLIASDAHSFMILVPRHPARFNEVANSCSKSGLQFIRLSQATQGSSFSQPQADFSKLEQLDFTTKQVLLADTINDLWLLYASSDLAFIGGSLVNKGGHNILEPAHLGLPIILGPHTANLVGILDPIAQAGGVLRVKNADELAAMVEFGLARPPVSKTRLRQLLIAHQGVAKSLIKHIDFLSPS